MTDLPNFIGRVKQKVNDYKSEFGIASERHSFAGWSLGYIHDIENEDAFTQTDTLAQGDGGLDGWYYDRQEQLFHLHQVKYPDDHQKVIGPDPIRELLTAFSIIEDRTTAYAKSEKLGKVSDELSEAMNEGAKVVLNCVVFGDLSEPAKEEFKNLSQAHPRKPDFEIWNIEKLYQLYVARETIDDLSGITIEIPVEDNEMIEVNPPEVERGIEESLIIIFNAKAFAKAIKDYDPKIFGRNVRFHLGHQNKVNTKIKETLIHEDNHQLFWHYNNGITVLVEDFNVNESNTLFLKNPQIVNGCQTVSAMLKNLRLMPDGVKLLAKIIKVPGTDSGKEQALLIAEYTNSQSPVKTPDLKANDPIQREIQANFRSLKEPYHYERKRGEWISLSESTKRRIFNYRRVNMIDIGQRWLCFIGEPVKAIYAKDEMFTVPSQYRKVYSRNIDARLYLLSNDIFIMFYEILNANKLPEIQNYYPKFDQLTLNRLIRGKKLVVGHCVALSKYIIDQRFSDITGPLAEQIKIIIAEDSSFKNSLIKWILIILHEFVEKQGPDEDIKAAFRREDTLSFLQSSLDRYIAFLLNGDKTLEEILKV